MTRTLISLILFACLSSALADNKKTQVFTVLKEYQVRDILDNNLSHRLGLVKHPERLSIHRDELGNVTHLNIELLPFNYVDITNSNMSWGQRERFYNEHKELFYADGRKISTYRVGDYSLYELQRIVLNFLGSGIGDVSTNTLRKLSVMKALDNFDGELWPTNTAYVYEPIVIPIIFEYRKQVSREEWEGDWE